MELEKPMYDENMMNKYIQTIKEQLHISDKEFEDIMDSPTHKHTDFATEDETYLGFHALKKAYNAFK